MIDRRHFLLGAAFALAPVSAMAALKKRTFSFGPGLVDVYAPAGAKNLPVLVYFFGGGWMTGDRGKVGALPEFAARLGVILVAADYRKVPIVGVSTQKADVAQAIRWARAHAPEFGGDPNRVAVMGHSSGAHLAALAVLDGSAGPVSALICNDVATYDIAAMAEAHGGKLPLLHRTVFRDRKRWAGFSPSSHIGEAAIPPVLIAWSKGEMHAELSKLFAGRLKAKGASVETYDGSARYSHREIESSIGRDSGGISAAIAGFLTRRLGLAT